MTRVEKACKKVLSARSYIISSMPGIPGMIRVKKACKNVFLGRSYVISSMPGIPGFLVRGVYLFR